MSSEINLQLAFNAPQLRTYRALVKSRRRTIVLAWGRGVGKSWFIRQLWWLLVARYDGVLRSEAADPFPGIRIVVLMPTLKQFKDVHLAGVRNDLSGKWSFLGGTVNAQSGQITFPGGSWIKPFPASEYNSKTARGLRADVLCADESDDIARSVYDSVATPWLSDAWSLGLEILAGTPRKGRHGLLFHHYQSGLRGKRARLGEDVAGLTREQSEQFAKTFSFHATYRDVPEIVSAEAVAKAKAHALPSVFAREWECDFDAGEGLVYGGAFVEAFHVRRPPPNVRWTEILVGADHGYEDPGVLLLIGVIGSGRDAVAWVIEEVYERHKLETWWVERLSLWTGWYPSARFYGDPSMPARVEAFRRHSQARVQEVDNAIEDGVAAVADRFLIQERWSEPADETTEPEPLPSTARLFISPACTNLIRELGLYKRKSDPRDPERYTDDIVDRDNHGPDALRYAIFNRFGGPDKRRGPSPHEALG